MNAQQTRRFEMLSRVHGFGLKHAAAFPPESGGAELFAELGVLVNKITTISAAKTTGSGLARQGSANRHRARRILRDDLEAISRTARAIAIRIPNVDRKFQPPRTSRDQALLDAARSFAAEAVPLKAEFARLALDEAFFEQLNADIAAFESALERQRDGNDTRSGASAAIEDALEDGALIARQLDSYVRNRFATEPLALNAWISASRVRGQGRGGRAEPPPPAETPLPEAKPLPEPVGV